jgi:hypothetical protein
MNQHLIAFCYLFTIILLFFAFFIVRCLPPGRPLNIDLYHSNMIISLAIYNPAEFNIPEGKKPENNWGAVTRDVLECRGERFVSREVLTKRCYVLGTKYLGFCVARGGYSEVKTISLGR